MNINNILGTVFAGCLFTMLYAIIDYQLFLNAQEPIQPTIETPIENPVQVVVLEPITVVEPLFDDFNCMARNIYFEARNQSEIAMAAVGYVVLNRVKSPAYKDSICEVIWRGMRDANGNYIKNKCQFSWVCDGKSDQPKEQKAWRKSQEIARKVINGEIANPIGNAVMYHADYADPSWKTAYNPLVQIESHIFYAKLDNSG